MSFTRRRDYLELVRIFLTPTALADSVAGFALAASYLESSPRSTSLAFVGAASVLIYSAGMVFNDVFDRRRDARTAPGKPIPSGRVSPAQAATVGAILSAAGLACAAAAGAIEIAVFILLAATLYDAGAKYVPIVGNLTMGACRGGNLLMGAAAVTGSRTAIEAPVIVAAAGILGLYIAVVTAVSVLEGPDVSPRFSSTRLLHRSSLSQRFCPPSPANRSSAGSTGSPSSGSWSRRGATPRRAGPRPTRRPSSCERGSPPSSSSTQASSWLSDRRAPRSELAP